MADRKRRVGTLRSLVMAKQEGKAEYRHLVNSDEYFSHSLIHTSVQWLNNHQDGPSFYLYLLFDKFNELSNLFSKK